MNKKGAGFVVLVVALSVAASVGLYMGLKRKSNFQKSNGTPNNKKLVPLSVLSGLAVLALGMGVRKS